MKVPFELPFACTKGAHISPSGTIQYFEPYRAIQLAYMIYRHLAENVNEPEVYITTVLCNMTPRYIVSICKPSNLGDYDCFIMEKVKLSEKSNKLTQVVLLWEESKEACEMPAIADRYFIASDITLANLIDTVREPESKIYPWLDKRMSIIFAGYSLENVSATGYASVAKPFFEDKMVVAVPLTHDASYFKHKWEISNVRNADSEDV
ncbi:hypothetical protein SM033_00187 [Vibrio phage vB_VpaM_sm033]|nr:hypothetical protein SM033_00187 [Vibrio phage vB_VpaM_sm033]